MSRLSVVLLAVVISPMPAAADQNDELVVTINGDALFEPKVVAECDNRVNSARAREAAHGLVLDESARQLARDLVRTEVLNALIERRLIAQQLATDGLVIADEEVEAAFRAKAASMGQTPDEAAQIIAEQGRTLAAVKERIRWNILGVERLYERHARSKMALSGEDARRIYYEYPGEFDLEERRRVSHLLVRFPAVEGDGDAARSAARAEADAFLARIHAGEDFAGLVRAHSDDESTRDSGGDRGYSTRGIIVDETTDPFGNAAFALAEIGDVSGVVESADGFHIIQLTDLQPARRQAFDEVKQQLIDDFHYREVARFWEQFGGQLRARATLEWSSSEMQRQAEARERQRRFNERVERLIAAEEKQAVEPPAATHAGHFGVMASSAAGMVHCAARSPRQAMAAVRTAAP